MYFQKARAVPDAVAIDLLGDAVLQHRLLAQVAAASVVWRGAAVFLRLLRQHRPHRAVRCL